MFTRIPTFIPTNSLETVNEQPNAKKAEVKRTPYGIAQGRRKRVKAIQKRIATKQAEYNHCEEVPVISGRDSRSRAHTLLTPSHFHKLRNSKLFETRTTSPYTTPVQKAKIISKLNKKVGRLSEYSETTKPEGILHMETDLTQPTVHTRNRKLNDDIHNTQMKKQANKWLVTNMDSNPSTSLERIVIRSESIQETESLLKTPLPRDTQSSSRTLRSHYQDGEAGKNFKSKIPVRFPDIHENKRNTEGKLKNNSTKLATYLPPIMQNVHTRKNSPVKTGHVPQSILDYQSVVEQDFKRLGENLENTFKLLQQYIKTNTNLNATT